MPQICKPGRMWGISPRIWEYCSAHMLHGAGIFTNICPCPKSPSFVGKYSIHGAYGVWNRTSCTSTGTFQALQIAERSAQMLPKDGCTPKSNGFSSFSQKMFPSFCLVKSLYIHILVIYQGLSEIPAGQILPGKIGDILFVAWRSLPMGCPMESPFSKRTVRVPGHTVVPQFGIATSWCVYNSH